jgi:FtsP/CotA-like multicopper oxidase with cupredoxin domain
MLSKAIGRSPLVAALLLAWAALPADAGHIRVQCPTSTEKHPDGSGIKCEHLAAGDGLVTMADGKPLYMFGFSRLPIDLPDPDAAMDLGMLAANFPAPPIVVDQGDELFLTLTNVGMTLRPDLFDPHTVHWHGFPNAASVFDGVPDSSVAIGMGASLTYYYNVVEPGTYMYHCHVEATEHMQMGMLGSLYVHARQDRCGQAGEPACPEGHAAGDRYAYNDGDGSTRYDREYPIQLGSFDPDFHEASVSIQPLPFADMRDRYFMMNGRGYPDTIDTAELATSYPGVGESNGNSQKENALVEAAPGERVLLRLSNLNVTQANTVGTVGIPMKVVGIDAKLLRDDAGNNQYYDTYSVTLGGGQSIDVILDTTDVAPGTYFLYSTNLQFLSNDRQNFGGMMTEIRVGPAPAAAASAQ